jgi:hypothetical protein
MVIENMNLSSDRNRATLLWSNDTDLDFCHLSVYTLSAGRIQVRINPLHPYPCHRRLNGAVLWTRPEQPRPLVTAGVAQ